MVSGIHWTFLVLGVMTIVSSLIFGQLQPGDGAGDQPAQGAIVRPHPKTPLSSPPRGGRRMAWLCRGPPSPCRAGAQPAGAGLRLPLPAGRRRQRGPEPPHGRPRAPSGCRWMFTDWSYVRRYIPLGWLNFSATYEFAGLNPRPYHAVALGLFLLNCGARLCARPAGAAPVLSRRPRDAEPLGLGRRGGGPRRGLVGAPSRCASRRPPGSPETSTGSRWRFSSPSLLAYLRTYCDRGRQARGVARASRRWAMPPRSSPTPSPSACLSSSSASTGSGRAGPGPGVPAPPGREGRRFSFRSPRCSRSPSRPASGTRMSSAPCPGCASCRSPAAPRSPPTSPPTTSGSRGGRSTCPRSTTRWWTSAPGARPSSSAWRRSPPSPCWPWRRFRRRPGARGRLVRIPGVRGALFRSHGKAAHGERPLRVFPERDHGGRARRVALARIATQRRPHRSPRSPAWRLSRSSAGSAGASSISGPTTGCSTPMSPR